jgi:hypothetical protein
MRRSVAVGLSFGWARFLVRVVFFGGPRRWRSLDEVMVRLGFFAGFPVIANAGGAFRVGSAL